MVKGKKYNKKNSATKKRYVYLHKNLGARYAQMNATVSSRQNFYFDRKIYLNFIFYY